MSNCSFKVKLLFPLLVSSSDLVCFSSDLRHLGARATVCFSWRVWPNLTVVHTHTHTFCAPQGTIEFNPKQEHNVILWHFGKKTVALVLKFSSVSDVTCGNLYRLASCDIVYRVFKLTLPYKECKKCRRRSTTLNTQDSLMSFYFVFTYSTYIQYMLMCLHVCIHLYVCSTWQYDSPVVFVSNNRTLRVAPIKITAWLISGPSCLLVSPNILIHTEAQTGFTSWETDQITPWFEQL